MPITQRRPSLRNGRCSAASTNVSFQEPMKVADSAKDSAGKLPMWRAEWDAVHAKGDCPYPPHPPRKYQWLPCTNSGPILNAIGLLMWVPLGIVVFCVSLFLNLWTWFIAYTYHGGAHGLAASTTLPLSNRIIRKLFSLVDVCNVTELPKPWDEAKAKQAFDAFRVRNGFAEEEARILVTTIPDTVMKPEVWHKYRMTDLASTAKVHYVHVLTAPSKTFVVGYTNFRDFDGTSCFNLIKGFVAVVSRLSGSFSSAGTQTAAFGERIRPDEENLAWFTVARPKAAGQFLTWVLSDRLLSTSRGFQARNTGASMSRTGRRERWHLPSSAPPNRAPSTTSSPSSARRSRGSPPCRLVASVPPVQSALRTSVRPICWR